MTDYELEKINAERRRKGLLPLNRSQANSALNSHPSNSDPSFDMTHFLIGYVGIPMPSAACIIGAVTHPSPAHCDPSLSYSAPHPSPSYSSSDSSFSSSSYDSGGSSSSWGGSDGGGSDGGGSDGGGL
jgi:uncharacterized membrane protein YgcG